MIVVADDDKVMTQLLSTLLEEEGYKVEVAHDGQQAYALLQKPTCRGAILDIRMPGVNGAELLLLMASEGLSMPVIVVAGFPDFDEEEMKEFPNVKRLFLKPLYPEELLAAAREYFPQEN